MSDGLQTEILVAGITCGHCVRSVTNELRAIAGVSDVEVALIPNGASRVRLTTTAPIDPGLIRDAVAEAGYALAASES